MKSMSKMVMAVLMVLSLLAPPAMAADDGAKQNGVALTAFLVVAAVVASPLTVGGSFGLLAVAWPAVAGAVGSGTSALSQ